MVPYTFKDSKKNKLLCRHIFSTPQDLFRALIELSRLSTFYMPSEASSAEMRLLGSCPASPRRLILAGDVRSTEIISGSEEFQLLNDNSSLFGVLLSIHFQPRQLLFDPR